MLAQRMEPDLGPLLLDGPEIECAGFALKWLTAETRAFENQSINGLINCVDGWRVPLDVRIRLLTADFCLSELLTPNRTFASTGWPPAMW